MKNTRILMLLMVLIMVSSSQADVIDVEQARTNVAVFVNATSGNSARTFTGKRAQGTDMELLYTRRDEADGQPLFYVFQTSKEKGYVIASADDATSPVLAYSYNSVFSTEDMPCCARFLLDGYARQVSDARHQPARRSERRVSAMDIQPAVAPLVACEWGQNEPYNDLCPIDPNTGERCVTGCVATALAQLMYHYKWPATGTGSFSYTWRDQTLSADFGNTHYQWFSMMAQDEHFGESVSTLMYHVGVANNMAYSSEGSGSIPHMTPLHKFFGYTEEENSIYLNATTLKQFEETLYNELKNQRPVLFGGYNDSESNGHAFVCDAYENGYFHMKLGWAGLHDGYFQMDGMRYNKDVFFLYGKVPQNNATAVDVVTVDGNAYAVEESSGRAVLTQSACGESAVIPATIAYNGRTYDVVHAERYCFKGNEQLTRATIDNDCVYKFRDGLEGSKTVDVIQVLPMFFGNDVREVVIGDHVTNVKQRTFQLDTNLTSVTIGNVKTIEESAFVGCSNITSLTLSAGIDSIGFYAFGRCTGLKTLNVPASHMRIHDSAFLGCNFSSVTLNNNEMVKQANRFESEEFILNEGITAIPDNAFRSCTGTKNISLPQGVTSIGNNAFYTCADLTSMDIPESVTSIGNRAFYDCRSLQSVNIPASVTCIGDEAFAHCWSLSEIAIPSALQSLGSDVFFGCNKLAKVTINNNAIVATNYQGEYDGLRKIFNSNVKEYVLGDEVTAIGDYAFANCDDMESIQISGNITSIGVRAFYGCSSLASLTVPATVKSIGEYAFYDCVKVRNVYFLWDDPTVCFWDYSNPGIELNKQVTIHVPAGTIEKYKAWAPAWADYFTEDQTPVLFTYYVKVTDSQQNVSWVEMEAINNGNGISLGTDMSVPAVRLEGEGLTLDLGEVWSDNDGDESTGTHYSVTAVGYWAFANCPALSGVIIPGSVKSIDGYAFLRCENLQEVFIPEGVQTIGYSAFWGCSGLKSVVIPNSVTSIDTGAFSDCLSLQSVFSHIETPFPLVEIYGSVFSDETYGNATLYVPKNTKAAYESTDGWNRFTKIVEQGESGIESKMVAAPHPVGYYDTSGRKLNGLRWGVNILRMSDGKTIKLIGNR